MPEATTASLLKLIDRRRRSLERFLKAARPRAERLTYASIISSAVAAALTAGPALGGQGFTGTVSDTLGVSPTVWQPLCLLATVASVVAVVSANLSKSRNAESRIINAEVACAELEGLHALVEFGQVPLEEGVKLYQQYVTKVPFVPESTRG